MNYLANITRHHFAGEIKSTDGIRSMCISPSMIFGGGYGAVWVTENTAVLFTTRNHPSFIKAICRRVVPLEKSVVFEITHGNTWGCLVSGTLVRIHCNDIVRLHADNEVSHDLVQHSQRFASQYRAKMAFRNISIKEIERAVGNHESADMSRRLGEDTYKRLQNIVSEYLRICKKLASNSNPDVSASVDRIYQMLKQ